MCWYGVLARCSRGHFRVGVRLVTSVATMDRLDEHMSLSSEYRQQFGWRAWPKIIEALPAARGQVVLDLGCAVGDHSDLPTALTTWSANLRPGGWIALTEVDNLFGHEPLGPRAKGLLDAYAQEALAAQRYDFHMGRKLKDHLERSGFQVSSVLTVVDEELSFDGPAQPAVLEAWQNRFDRLTLLRRFCGDDFENVRDGFLRCLRSADHRLGAKVYCCLGWKCGADKVG